MREWKPAEHILAKDAQWYAYIAKLKSTLGPIPKDKHGRKQLHCQCGLPVLVSLKWLYEEGNCLKWYGVQPVGADHMSMHLERCPSCGVVYGYPPPLREISDCEED